jgi:hypothetical protein
MESLLRLDWSVWLSCSRLPPGWTDYYFNLELGPLPRGSKWEDLHEMHVCREGRCLLLISASDIRLLEEILRGSFQSQRPPRSPSHQQDIHVHVLVPTTSSSFARPSYLLSTTKIKWWEFYVECKGQGGKHVSLQLTAPRSASWQESETFGDDFLRHAY